MNTENFNVYRTEEEIEAAKKRGEPLMEIPNHIADLSRFEREAYVREQLNQLAPKPGSNTKSVLYKDKNNGN